MNKIDRISFSSLSDYYKCPRYFFLKHIQKVAKDETSVFMSFGKSIHFITEQMIKGTIKDKEEIEKMFDMHFVDELKTIAPIKESEKDLVPQMREQAKVIFPQLLPSLKEYFGEFDLVDIEHLIHEPITEFETLLNFKGYVDVIIKTRDNKIHIIDYKTCGWGWDARKKADKKILYQLIYYKHFYAKKMNIPLENIECHFVLLKRTAKKNNIESFRITSGQKRIENAINYLRKPCQNIERGFFLKNKLHCDECQFKGTEFCK